MVVVSVGGIDVPAQPVRISQPVRPDLLPRPWSVEERIIFRNPISPIVAENAGTFVLFRIRDDAKNFSYEIVEPLWIGTPAIRLLSRTAVATGNVHDAPVGIAPAGGRVKDHVVHRVHEEIQLYPHDFPRGAFKCRIGDFRISPLDDDS